MPLPKPVTELELARLSALYRYGILDTGSEPVFDVIAAELVQSAAAPIAQITFVDATRLWDKASIGGLDRETPRRGSLCTTIIDGQPILIVPDTLELGAPDTVTLACPPHVRAFAGVRLGSPDDDAIGVVSVADLKPRSFGAPELAALDQAAAQVMILLESRRRSGIDEATGALNRAAFEEQIQRMATVTVSGGQSLSLVLLDLDSFRTQLDGLQVGLGRIVLRRLADLGRDHLRRRDSFGRLGENRFGVLLADTDEAGARILAHRLIDKIVEGWSAMSPGSDAKPIVVGIASVQASVDQAPSLLARAEKAACAPLRRVA